MPLGSGSGAAAPRRGRSRVGITAFRSTFRAALGTARAAAVKRLTSIHARPSGRARSRDAPEVDSAHRPRNGAGDRGRPAQVHSGDRLRPRVDEPRQGQTRRKRDRQDPERQPAVAIDRAAGTGPGWCTTAAGAGDAEQHCFASWSGYSERRSPPTPCAAAASGGSPSAGATVTSVATRTSAAALSSARIIGSSTACRRASAGRGGGSRDCASGCIRARPGRGADPGDRFRGCR